MSAGGARRGRRDNGLDATEYAVAGDVDPRIGEHLLDLLAAGGIAAYLQPSADLNPVTHTTTVPPRPIDRLYVDRAHLATARDYLTQLADEDVSGRPDSGNTPDVDAAWDRIVAGYYAEVATDARTWPAAEDVITDERPDPTAEPVIRTGSESTGPATGVRQLPSAIDISGISVGGRVAGGRTDDGRTDDGALLDGLDTFGAALPDDPEDRYIPPPPPPLPQLSKFAVVGVLSIIAGFILFLFPDLLPVDRLLATMLGFTGILGGFVTLIWRLRPGDEEENDDPANGAVV